MKSAILLLIVAAVSGFTYHDLVLEEWNTFKLEHNKQYESEQEERNRMAIYAKNKYEVAKHNKAYAQGLTSFKMGLNKYSDRSPSEIQRMSGYTQNDIETGGIQYIPSHQALPEEMEWLSKGAVTPIKDQGQCGACWAFSATGALEGQHFRKTGRLLSLSEQNLVDCSDLFDNLGCVGGNAERAFTYVASNGGIDTDESYPYTWIQGVCKYNPKYSNVTARGFVRLPSGDEEALKAAVTEIGPISIAIDSTPKSFSLYSSGVYYEKNCSSKKLNHQALLVGYGSEQPGGDFWKVKNSWGATWGDEGYIKLARNRGNHCGVATMPVYPLV